MYVAVVDDQDASLAGFSQILRRVADVEPICFKKGTDALHWLGGVEPAFIVVNSTLADFTGIDFLRRLRVIAGRETTPVIFTTGKAERDLRRTAFELDVYAFLEKPINPSEFLVHAMHIVDNSRARADMQARLKEVAQRAAMEEPEDSDEDSRTIETLLEVGVLHDPTLMAHHALASQLATILGREAKLTDEELHVLSQATRIYDIGKVAIPQRILEARGQLPTIDRALIEKHCDAGTRLLAARETPVMRAAANISQTHHERYDGSGYPRKLRGSQIPIMGRIVAVADSLAAMVRTRADRPAMTLAQAIEVIDKASGSAFDPIIVNAIRLGLNDISRVVHESQQSAQAS